MNATFIATPIVIFNRRVELTSTTKSNNQMIMDDKYQGHATALTKSDLVPKIFPTLN